MQCAEGKIKSFMQDMKIKIYNETDKIYIQHAPYQHNIDILLLKRDKHIIVTVDAPRSLPRQVHESYVHAVTTHMYHPCV
jgi:hypothetical protein